MKWNPNTYNECLPPKLNCEPNRTLQKSWIPNSPTKLTCGTWIQHSDMSEFWWIKNTILRWDFFLSPIIIFVVSSHKLYMMARKLTPRKSSKQFCYFLNTQINFLKNLYLMTVIYYFKNCIKKGKKLFFKAKIIFHGNLFEGLSIA